MGKDLLPIKYVVHYQQLTMTLIRHIKREYKSTAVIYLWVNPVTGRHYVGRSTNFHKRLENYLNPSYINRTMNSMPICGALNKYGFGIFELYILEVVSATDVDHIALREAYWADLLKPTYNIAAIVDTFVGVNHPRYGKEVSVEVRVKISATLTGRQLTQEHRDNMSLGQARQSIYCYDYDTGVFVVMYPGMRPMCRALGIASALICS